MLDELDLMLSHTPPFICQDVMHYGNDGVGLLT